MEISSSKRLLDLLEDYINARARLRYIVDSNADELYILTKSDQLSRSIYDEEYFGRIDDNKIYNFLGLLDDSRFKMANKRISDFLSATDQDENDFILFRDAVNDLVNDYLLLLNSFPPEYLSISKELYETFKNAIENLSFTIGEVLVIRHDLIYI